MIIIIKRNAPQDKIKEFSKTLEKKGVKVHHHEGSSKAVLGLIGDTTGIDEDTLLSHHLVEKVIRIQEPYKRASRFFHPEDTRIVVSDSAGTKHCIGDGILGIIAGPCSVETRDQITTIAREVKKAGAGFLRGGAFKPRTSHYSFQGLGSGGLELLIEAKKETGLPVVTEIMDISQLEAFDYVDVIQVGARNMQNFMLLKELGRCKKPILLKRGYACTVSELLMAAEYIMTRGNVQVILCERGIRTFNDYARNTLDLSAIPAIKKESHLPVIVDPSHATGFSWMVPSMAKAAVAAGADGIMLEVHNDPENALCDGEQSITPAEFASLMECIKKYAVLEGKKIT
jgi:3-deoxy-7-phosphoheptulonate synthase